MKVSTAVMVEETQHLVDNCVKGMQNMACPAGNKDRQSFHMLSGFPGQYGSLAEAEKRVQKRSCGGFLKALLEGSEASAPVFKAAHQLRSLAEETQAPFQDRWCASSHTRILVGETQAPVSHGMHTGILVGETQAPALHEMLTGLSVEETQAPVLHAMDRSTTRHEDMDHPIVGLPDPRLPCQPTVASDATMGHAEHATCRNPSTSEKGIPESLRGDSNPGKSRKVTELHTRVCRCCGKKTRALLPLIYLQLKTGHRFIV